METDYESPPHAFSSRKKPRQLTKVYGKKKGRKALVDEDKDRHSSSPEDSGDAVCHFEPTPVHGGTARSTVRESEEGKPDCTSQSSRTGHLRASMGGARCETTMTTLRKRTKSATCGVAYRPNDDRSLEPADSLVQLLSATTKLEASSSSLSIATRSQSSKIFRTDPTIRPQRGVNVDSSPMQPRNKNVTREASARNSVGTTTPNPKVHRAASTADVPPSRGRGRNILSDKSNLVKTATLSPRTTTTKQLDSSSPRLTKLPPRVSPRLTRFHSIRTTVTGSSSDRNPLLCRHESFLTEPRSDGSSHHVVLGSRSDSTTTTMTTEQARRDEPAALAEVRPTSNNPGSSNRVADPCDDPRRPLGLRGPRATTTQRLNANDSTWSYTRIIRPSGSRSPPPPPPPRSSLCTADPDSTRPSGLMLGPVVPGTGRPPTPTRRPTFRFTTTVFENSLHFTVVPRDDLVFDVDDEEFGFSGDPGTMIDVRPRRGVGCDFGVVEGKEGDGLGMESTFLLESWREDGDEDDDDYDDDVGNHDLTTADGDDPAACAPAAGGEEGKDRTLDQVVEHDEQAGPNQDRQDDKEVPGRGSSHTAGEGLVRATFGTTRRGREVETVRIERERDQSFADETDPTMSPGEASEASHCRVGAPPGEEADTENATTSSVPRIANSGDGDRSMNVDEAEGRATRVVTSRDVLERPDRRRYDAAHLPPRRPRAPRRPTSACEDEDDLAYLIRTTLTHSSEDDVGSSEDGGSSDERDFRAAEREVGRGIKSSSGQRRKRIEASEYLRIGAGVGGRRLRWKRVVLDEHEHEHEHEHESEDDDLAIAF